MSENNDNTMKNSGKNTDGLKPWKPGQSGNPKGRPPKGQALADVMREYLEGKIEGKGVLRKEAFVRAVFAKAMKGGDAAMKLIMNYLDGMPRQAVDLYQNIEVEDNEKIDAIFEKFIAQRIQEAINKAKRKK